MHFSDQIVESIHKASLELLADPGVQLQHEGIANCLLKKGARPGSDAGILRLPPEMVREYIQLCPTEVTLAGRTGATLTITSRSSPTFWSAPGLNLYHRGHSRPFTSADMAKMARLFDQLPHIDVVFGMALDDVPPPARDVVGLRIIAENTSKHVRVLCFSPESMDLMVEMKDVLGDYPRWSLGFTAHGPLRWIRLALEVFRRTAGHGIPVTVNGEPMAGTSAPVTLCGTATVGNAEILAGLVVNQVMEPGRPCIYNLGLAHVFDMKTAIAITGGPENHLLAGLSGLMGRFYGIPSASWVSTEAMSPDAQAALEKMFGFHTHMENRVNAIRGAGQLESELTISPAQAVIDNEMIAYAQRYEQGLGVSPESLAVEITRSVGVAGCFLDHEHTFRHFRSEIYELGILFRKRRPDWAAESKKTLCARAEEVAEELVTRPVGHPLEDDKAAALAALVEKRLQQVQG